MHHNCKNRWILPVGWFALASLLLVACGGGGDDDAGSDGGTAVAELAGAWRTRSISPADAEATLDAGGLSAWIDELRAAAPFDGDTVLVLEIGEEWDLYGESADGVRTEIDYDASYEVDGDEVVVTHSAGSNTFRWEVSGDTLTLEHLESTMPAYEGVPEEVFQRALYMTAAFTRDA